MVDDVRKKEQRFSVGGMNTGLRFISDLCKKFRIIVYRPGLAPKPLYYQRFLVLNGY